MILKQKTLEKLRNLINEETEYRTGPKLVAFFNDLGSRDSYGQWFPSRWIYTDQKLAEINGKPELDKCIKKLFDPQNFIGKTSELDEHIKNFNDYLTFDKWQVMRVGAEITFKKCDTVILKEDKKNTHSEIKEDDFLNKEFADVSLATLGLENSLVEILNARLDEIKRCFTAKAPLSVIFLAGSTLEWILLGTALRLPKKFNQAAWAPKDKEGKVKHLQNWSLNQFIDVAYELGLIKEDVKKFSHALRDFRNYIHPYEQLGRNFHPDEQTAKICWQVLKAAIFQLSNK